MNWSGDEWRWRQLEWSRVEDAVHLLRPRRGRGGPPRYGLPASPPAAYPTHDTDDSAPRLPAAMLAWFWRIWGSDRNVNTAPDAATMRSVSAPHAAPARAEGAAARGARRGRRA